MVYKPRLLSTTETYGFWGKKTSKSLNPALVTFPASFDGGEISLDKYRDPERWSDGGVRDSRCTASAIPAVTSCSHPGSEACISNECFRQWKHGDAQW